MSRDKPNVPEIKGELIALQGMAGESKSMRHSCHRAKVPGGWLIWQPRSHNEVPQAPMVFIPDPEHTWDGNSLP